MAILKWEDFKKYCVILTLIVLILTPIIAVTPLGPGAVKSYIDRYNPEGEPVKPWATEWMFKLGRFYGITLRDESAMETYNELFEWYFDADREIDEEDPWVGIALYRYAMILSNTGHIQQATQKMERFVDNWGDNPEVDATIIHTAKSYIATSKFRTRE